MLKISILYDNRSISRDFIYGWGFSCLIETEDYTILFDTGGRGDVLLSNMEKMNVDVNAIEHIFLSHIHGDHTGGLTSILEKKPKVTVWIPDSFPESAKFDIGTFGARVRSIKKPSHLFKNVYSTGELGRSPKEHALIIDEGQEIILITGCAHPGIANFSMVAKNYLNKDIALVLGGMHLGGLNKKEINHIIGLLKQIGVKKVAPCHCTGEYAIELFKSEYKENFIEVATGSVIQNVLSS